MPTLLHPDDPAFHRMVAAFEGDPGPWLALNRALRDAMVVYAQERSPYYREAVPPGAPFEEIPILTKEIIRERYDDLLAEGVHRDRWAPWRTSGSTGTPMAFVRDTAQGDLENLSAQRFLRWMQGIPPDATAVWVAARAFAPPRPRRPLLGRRPDPEVHPVPTGELTAEGLERQVRTWSRLRTWFLYGHASAIGWIAEEIQQRGLELRGLHSVVTTSDLLTGHVERRIGVALGVPIHSWYGSNEMNGYVGATLPGSRRYALNPLLVHAEIVDDRGAPVSPGAAGRLLLTDLNNLVMPFIRYDTGDMAVASGETRGGFPLVEDLVGRDSEVLRLPDGRILNAVTLGNALFVVNDLVDAIRGFQCARTGPNELELRVVWGTPPTPELERAVIEAARFAVDGRTQLRVRGVERLGVLPSGKAWLIRDETRAD